MPFLMRGNANKETAMKDRSGAQFLSHEDLNVLQRCFDAILEARGLSRTSDDDAPAPRWSECPRSPGVGLATSRYQEALSKWLQTLSGNLT